MAFDLEALMQNPMFQSGLATLGGAVNSPGLLNAYNALQARKKLEMEQQQQASQRALEQEKAKQYATQNEIAMMNAKRQQRLMEMGEKAMRDLMEPSGGDSGMPGTPIPSQQPALMAPPEPVGKYGTPARILDNLEQTESSGNPLALGPVLPNGQRAKGAYQFLDSTRDMLVSQGFPKFDVFNKQQSRDAADYYLSQLTKQHGSLEAALGAYGGFKSKDPSAYVNKILGSPEKQAAQSAQQSALAAQSAKYKKAQQIAGAMQLAAGDVGGFKSMTEGMKPDYEGARLQQQEQQHQENLQIRAAEETRKQTEATQKLTVQRATDFGQVQGVLDSSRQLNVAAEALRNNPGLDHITGRYAGLPDALRAQIDPQGMNAKADLDALGSKILLSTISSLKALSQNGSTGFGQLSNVEGEHLVNSVASLKQAQTTEQVKQRLSTVVKATNSVMDRAVEVYERTHNASPYEGLPIGTKPLRDAATGAQKLSKNGFPLYKLPNGKLVEERQ